MLRLHSNLAKEKETLENPKKLLNIHLLLIMLRLQWTIFF
jgi:hypothetical protein